ncbi:MAG: prepilin-type N-terminal cleavage/methylation domain-containing protein [Gammaproteobacteria bacterium]|nr:prepilin-type N-terminal cleavage/methylation domain-containing protein [Gammaproteobacteria bacterium]
MFINKKNKGFTLIEIIVTILIISIAAPILIQAFSSIVRSSANPMLLQQSISIAQSYLEKITLLSYDDPNDGGDSLLTGPKGPELDEGTESLYDDVDDYHNFSDTELTDFTIDITIGNEETLNNAIVKKITATVTHPAIDDFILIGYKAYYDDSKTY